MDSSFTRTELGVELEYTPDEARPQRDAPERIMTGDELLGDHLRDGVNIELNPDVDDTRIEFDVAGDNFTEQGRTDSRSLPDDLGLDSAPSVQADTGLEGL